MSGYGRTIRIYLADGSPTGIKHAELVNWTGQAIVCPRPRVAELSGWPESQRPGVYILLGEDETATKSLIYIGEAENVLSRLQSHVRNKEFWDRVIFFTSKDENLTKAHVKYLEARMVRLATDAGRAALENGNVPQPPLLPRADRDAMEEFLGPVIILLGALGSPLLQPVVRQRKGNVVNAPEPAQGSDGPLSETPLFFRVPKTGVRAEGRVTDEGFVVLSGSVGDAGVKESLSQGRRDLRDELIAQGRIEISGSKAVLTHNVLFNSASAAASVLAGCNVSGPAVWKDDEGSSLRTLESALLPTD